MLADGWAGGGRLAETVIIAQDALNCLVGPNPRRRSSHLIYLLFAQRRMSGQKRYSSGSVDVCDQHSHLGMGISQCTAVGIDWRCFGKAREPALRCINFPGAYATGKTAQRSSSPPAHRESCCIKCAEGEWSTARGTA